VTHRQRAALRPTIHTMATAPTKDTGHLRRLAPGGGLLRVGGGAAADGGGVGIRRALAAGKGVPVGGRVRWDAAELLRCQLPRGLG